MPYSREKFKIVNDHYFINIEYIPAFLLVFPNFVNKQLLDGVGGLLGGRHTDAEVPSQNSRDLANTDKYLREHHLYDKEYAK